MGEVGDDEVGHPVRAARLVDEVIELSINAIQGYLYSKPLGAMQLRRIITDPIPPVSIKTRRLAGLDGDRTRRAS